MTRPVAKPHANQHSPCREYIQNLLLPPQAVRAVISSADRYFSKRNSQSQPHCAAAVNALLRESSVCFPEIRVCIVVFVCQCRRGAGDNREISNVGEQVEASAKIGVRHSDWMIEDIVKVGSETGDNSLAKFKVFVHTKVYSPAPRTPEKASLGHRGI